MHSSNLFFPNFGYSTLLLAIPSLFLSSSQTILSLSSIAWATSSTSNATIPLASGLSFYPFLSYPLSSCSASTLDFFTCTTPYYYPLTVHIFLLRVSIGYAYSSTSYLLQFSYSPVILLIIVRKFSVTPFLQNYIVRRSVSVSWVQRSVLIWGLQ